MTHTSLLLIWHTPVTHGDEEFEEFEENEDYYYFDQYEEDEGYKDCATAAHDADEEQVECEMTMMTTDQGDWSAFAEVEFLHERKYKKISKAFFL